MPSSILVVITSNAKLGDSGKSTGVWLEEVAAPYLAFKEAGHSVTLASPLGGQPPIDPGSEADGAQTDATRRFKADAAAVAALAATHKLADVAPGAAQKYDAVFYPGGHGGLWDLAGDATSIALIESFAAAGKPVGAVCHGPAVLVACKKPDGSPLVAGLPVAAFTNTEEAAVQLTAVVPFLLEDKFKELGANYTKVADWAPHAVSGTHAGVKLATGQNPASSDATAKALMSLL